MGTDMGTETRPWEARTERGRILKAGVSAIESAMSCWVHNFMPDADPVYAAERISSDHPLRPERVVVVPCGLGGGGVAPSQDFPIPDDESTPRLDGHEPEMKVLAVGQTPPPYHGQAIAIDSFVRGVYDHMQVFTVRMSFSAEVHEIGKLRIGKLRHLAALVVRILWARVRTGAKVLYYPPAGADLVPVLRDLVVLLSTRWAFDQTVFHFHAGGLSESIPACRVLRYDFRATYLYPDLAIQPSPLNPLDSEFVRARRAVVVPNGVTDTFRVGH